MLGGIVFGAATWLEWRGYGVELCKAILKRRNAPVGVSRVFVDPALVRELAKYQIAVRRFPSGAAMRLSDDHVR